MKKFRFTLQALLVLRKRLEHEAMEKYAATLMARQRAGEALAMVEGELVQAANAMRNRFAKPFSAAELMHARNHYENLDTRRLKAAESLAAAERAVRPALQEMIQARRQREIVEDCEEKQRARHEREKAREEGKINDEIALRRFSPSMAGAAID